MEDEDQRETTPPLEDAEANGDGGGIRAQEDVVPAPKASVAPRKSWKTIGKMNWPFQITVDIAEVTKPKIAFGSGEERKYYPENPGHSKLAQVFVANSLKADSPVCTYRSPPLGVQKPVSTAGYGVGGLFAARFKDEEKQEKRPDPGSYQAVTVPPYPPPPKPCNTALPQCYRPIVDTPRFRRYSSTKTPGPGTYRLDSLNGKLKSQGAFGSKLCITPTTLTVCTFNAGELCTLCGKEQVYDYYRTKSKVKHPDSLFPDKPELVVICRKCYCRAWNGHHPYWNRDNLLFLFQKARHCSFVHEHHNLPLSIAKAQVKEIKKLTACESMLAKYFSDHCHPELKP